MTKRQITGKTEIPQISIITTAYNIEDYLSFCLDSILAQTFTDFELIMIDDGSTDRTGIICDEYSEKDSRIHVIHQENKGVSDSWNEAMKYVRGKYTGFVDGDDLIHPRMYELLYKAIQITQSDIAYCDHRRFSGEGTITFEKEPVKTDSYKTGAVYIDESDRIRLSTKEEEMERNIDFPTIWRGLYKSELIKQFTFISGRKGQDNLWSPCVALNAKRFARVDSVLYWYRFREQSESYIARTKRMTDWLYVKGCAIDYIQEHDPIWTTAYTSALFTHCVDAENQISKISDSAEKAYYRKEISYALRRFKKLSIVDIIKCPCIKNRRKLLAITGKISFPLACFIKRHTLKVIKH